MDNRCEQCHPDCTACLSGEPIVLTGDMHLLCATHAHLRLDLRPELQQTGELSSGLNVIRAWWRGRYGRYHRT